MGLKMIREKQKPGAKLSPVENPKIPFFMLQTIAGLLGKFRCVTYDDFEFIQKKKEALNAEFQKFSHKVQEDPTKAQEIWHSESEIAKGEFAWLPIEAFKAKVPEMNLSADEVGVLQFWVVKE